jgi:hypothetical protein
MILYAVKYFFAVQKFTLFDRYRDFLIPMNMKGTAERRTIILDVVIK